MGISAENAWGLILPVETVNLMEYNPSYEIGTTGAAAVQGATLGSASDRQAFGAWSLSVAPTSNGTSGAYVGTFTAGNGTNYTYSAYVLGSAGVDYMLAVGNTSNALVGSVLFTGGGTWQRYAGTYTEASGAVRRVIVRKANSANAASQGTFYVDGVQVEANPLTTYIDGEQDGCTWLGQPHASQSLRDGQARAGGSVVALADLGFDVGFHSGIGMPPVESSAQSYALLPGAEYQRTRAAPRTFTLTDVAVAANSREAYHAVRRTLIDAIKPDRVSPQQPVRFVYLGAGGTSFIDAVYTGGMELNDLVSVQAENTALQFTAYDPYFYSERDQGTALAARTNIGSANYIAARDRYGRWGTFSGFGNSVDALLCVNGTTFVGGQFSQAGGTQARFVAQIANGAVGTLTNGTLNNRVQALAWSPAGNGTLFLGGDFTLHSGTAGLRFAGQYANGTFGTLGPGTPNTSVFALNYTPLGTLFAGGAFSNAGGTQARFAAFWANQWGTLAGGTLNNSVFAIKTMPTGTVYVGGQFTSFGASAGTAILQWNASGFSTMGGQWQGDTNGTSVYALAARPDNTLVAGGNVLAIGGGTVNDIAQWNGVQWQSLGAGIGSAAADLVNAVLSDRTGGVYVAGIISKVNGIPLPTNAAYWTGAAWTPLDIDIIGDTQEVSALAQDAAGTLWIGGNFEGTANVASVAQVQNTGMAEAYPVITMRHVGASGTARIWQLKNAMVDAALYFNLALTAGETATLDMRPGARSFTSDFRGNLTPYMLPGSNLTGFRLVPGTNYLSFFGDSGSIQVSAWWRPRHWSADGTI